MATAQTNSRISELDSPAIDTDVFGQILEMDDDDAEFSHSIVYDYFSQASATFDDMDLALADKDLQRLSELGHFLKGSSAALGLTFVMNACEKIENLGQMRDDTGGTKVIHSQDECLALVSTQLTDAKANYRQVEVLLRRFYGEQIGVANTAAVTAAASASDGPRKE